MNYVTGIGGLMVPRLLGWRGDVGDIGPGGAKSVKLESLNVRIARCRWFDSVLILDLQHGVVEYVHWR